MDIPGLDQGSEQMTFARSLQVSRGADGAGVSRFLGSVIAPAPSNQPPAPSMTPANLAGGRFSPLAPACTISPFGADIHTGLVWVFPHSSMIERRGKFAGRKAKAA